MPALRVPTLSPRPRPRHLNIASRRAANRAYTGLAVFVSSVAVAATTTYGFAPSTVTAEGPIAVRALASSPQRTSSASPIGAAAGASIIGTGAGSGVQFPYLQPQGRAFSAAVTEAPAAASTLRPKPAFVRIPSIGTTSNLVRLGLEKDGSLEVPADFSVAGWFADGVVPGERGPAIIAGHYDSYVGPAVFSKLTQVKPGDPVEVTLTDGSLVEFVVERIDRYPKDYFPDEQVYGDTDQPELRLITCGGSFDKAKASYDDNIVVYARMI